MHYAEAEHYSQPTDAEDVGLIVASASGGVILILAVALCLVGVILSALLIRARSHKLETKSVHSKKDPIYEDADEVANQHSLELHHINMTVN